MSWFRVDDRLPRSRKVRKLGPDRLPAMGLWTLCGAWASDATDGFVPDEEVTRYDPEHYYAKRLCEVGLWEIAEEDGESGYAYHDWLDYQPTQEQQDKKRADTRRRVQAWRGRQRAEQEKQDAGIPAEDEPPPDDERSNAAGNTLRSDPSNAGRNAAPNPTPSPSSYGSRNVGGDVLSEIASATTDDAEPSADEPREDVEALCQHLADRIEGNGSKRPKITAKWRTEARLLLDRDGRDLEKAHRLIDWCQDHHHWRTRVMAMPRFRSEYDAMRLQANSDYERGRHRNWPRPSSSDAAAAHVQTLKRDVDPPPPPHPPPAQVQLRLAAGGP